MKNLLGGKEEYAVEPGQAVRDTIVSLGINPDLVAMVSVNDEMQNKDYLIQDGDVIRLMAVIGGG